MSDDIKEFGGLWFPAHEEHMLGWMTQRNERVDGKLTYQYHKLVAAMKHVRNFRTAIDVGAHVGMWSMHLAKRFERVLAFEPVLLHRQCFQRNTAGLSGVALRAYALGELPGFVTMHTTQGSSGDSWVEPESRAYGDERAVPVMRLDDVLANDEWLLRARPIDFIKLDCEGYELFALRGGEATLKANRPCVIVEQKPGRAQKWGLGERDAVPYLESLGAKLREEIAGDFILSWDE